MADKRGPRATLRSTFIFAKENSVLATPAAFKSLATLAAASKRHCSACLRSLHPLRIVAKVRSVLCISLALICSATTGGLQSIPPSSCRPPVGGSVARYSAWTAVIRKTGTARITQLGIDCYQYAANIDSSVRKQRGIWPQALWAQMTQIRNTSRSTSNSTHQVPRLSPRTVTSL